MTPPDHIVELAEEQARKSPCVKSKRGAVTFYHSRLDRVSSYVVSKGFNGAPSGLCDGSERCQKDCGKRCVHAEMRALRSVPEHWGPKLELVHVKIGDDGRLVPGGGPSCWQCSREILDIGIGLVWLFEQTSETTGEWRSYGPEEFHRITCENAKGGKVYL